VLASAGVRSLDGVPLQPAVEFIALVHSAAVHVDAREMDKVETRQWCAFRRAVWEIGLCDPERMMYALEAVAKVTLLVGNGMFREFREVFFSALVVKVGDGS